MEDFATTIDTKARTKWRDATKLKVESFCHLPRFCQHGSSIIFVLCGVLVDSLSIKFHSVFQVYSRMSWKSSSHSTVPTMQCFDWMGNTHVPRKIVQKMMVSACWLSHFSPTSSIFIIPAMTGRYNYHGPWPSLDHSLLPRRTSLFLQLVESLSSTTTRRIVNHDHYLWNPMKVSLILMEQWW
jgi:hypothetical protein